MALAARFYGLDLLDVRVNGPEDGPRAIKAFRRADALAVIVDADSLSVLRPETAFPALARQDGAKIPLMIVASPNHASSGSLAKWSGGLVSGCTSVVGSSREWQLAITQDAKFASQLAGVSLPFHGKMSCALKLASDFPGRVLIRASNHGDELPVLVSVASPGNQTFLMTSTWPDEGSPIAGDNETSRTFAHAAAVMMFLRNAAGDRAWHGVGLYANLTVDDPWLIEPYGGLDYQALAREMETHNFHTTIGFVPWNLDTSQSDVVRLFRQHPTRFSVSVHGNNHNHREFGDYSDRPLAGQTADLKQALARMEQFRRATQVPYDPVMVFPHAIAPAETFRALKTYNYWATINSENVPLGSRQSHDPLFSLRPQTLAFNNFLSVKRYSAEVPVSTTTIAVNAYLDNPLLFYVHQQFFRPNIGAFNAVADFVNRTVPNVQWRSLGDVVQHLYLVRLRQDNDYDVLAFSPNFRLSNTQDRTITFHVRKPENFIPPLRSLSVDDATAAYERSEGEIRFDVLMAPRQTRQIKITYVNDLNLPRVDISKANVSANILRWLSDFRDLTLTNNVVGRKLIAIYYRKELSRTAAYVERASILLLTFILIAGFGRSIVRSKKKRLILDRQGH